MKTEQGQVDVAEPRGDAVHLGRQRGGPRGDDKGDSEEERDERPRDGDPELGAGAGEHAAELGDPAEEPQCDSLDLHPLAARDERVAVLVQEQR